MGVREPSEAPRPAPGAPQDVRAVSWGLGPVVLVALAAGASASVGSVADSHDCEDGALNGTFKAELIEHQGP